MMVLLLMLFTCVVQWAHFKTFDHISTGFALSGVLFTRRSGESLATWSLPVAWSFSAALPTSSTHLLACCVQSS